MTQAHAPAPLATEHAAVDPQTAALSRLLTQLAEDAIYTYAAGGGAQPLEEMAKRRGEAYNAVLSGQRIHTLVESFDGYYAEMARAITPVYPPLFLPMSDVLREKVTLEIGARGLRSLFSSKPSEKDQQRVKRLGTLATRILRGVLASDGPIVDDDELNIRAFVAALGLPEADSAALIGERPMSAGQLDVYGDVELPVARALVRGAWIAAAWDAIDPREETFIRTFAQKLGLPAPEVEELRNEAVMRIDARRTSGLAAVDAVRYVMADRGPGIGVQLAVRVATLMLPLRFREEALAQIGHWTKVQLAKRYKDLPSDEKATVLAIGWAACLYDNPTVGRKALLRARHDRVAFDLGEDGGRARIALEDWVTQTMAPAAYPMTA